MRSFFISKGLVKIGLANSVLFLSFELSSQINRGFLTLKPQCLDIPTAVVDVVNPTTGKTWMDRNLGASRAAISSTDALAYGDLYQWGRFSDGHQCRKSANTSVNSATDSPGHADFIMETVDPYDWRTPQNPNLWQGVGGVNNPCPTGYRLATNAEWDAERLSWGSLDAAGAYGSVLKLTLAGSHRRDDGVIANEGIQGIYWTSTANPGVSSQRLIFNSGNAYMDVGGRAAGFSVRCIKE